MRAKSSGTTRERKKERKKERDLEQFVIERVVVLVTKALDTVLHGAWVVLHAELACASEHLFVVRMLPLLSRVGFQSG